MKKILARPRKTAAFIQFPKEKYIFDAQKYEIDEKQIYDFYQIIPKQERVYNVIKKQVAYGKDIAFKQIDKNKKFSNYSIFRQYMQKEVDIEDIKSDIEQAKLLMNLSENTRYKFYSYFRLDRADFIKTNETNNKFINIRKKPEKNNLINDEVLPTNDFLRKCIMLRRKREEDDNLEKPKTFTIFSDLNIQSGKFEAMNFLVNKNKLSEKYYQQKQKLIRCYNREEQFINYNKLIKQSVIQETPDNINKNIKDKYSSKYFDYIYDKREESHYEDIDKFFSQHEITNYKLKNEESDFYGKIYGILCKNNYLKFLSFLYSKNEIFKFIYDIFSDKEAQNNDISLEDSSIGDDKYKLGGKSFEDNEESFGDIMRRKEMGNNLQNKKKTMNLGFGLTNLDDTDNKEGNKINDERRNNLMDNIFNNYVYIKIGFLNEAIKLKNINEFFETDENDEDDDGEEENKSNKKNKKFYKYLKKCAKEPVNCILLISNKKKMIIMDNKLESIFEQKMSEISFIKIKKDYLKNILKNKIKSLYPSEDIQFEYYLFQNINEETNKKEYYLIKIQKKNIQFFDKQMSDNDFSLMKIKDFINELDINKSKKEKEKEKKKVESLKQDLKEKFENENDKDNENIIEEKEKSEKEEIKEEKIQEKQFAGPSSFNKSEIESEKYSASILNDDSDNKIEDLIKIENIKKTSEYQREHKYYEFTINKEKYFFDIYQGQLRYKVDNNKNKAYELKEIFPQKVEEDKDNSCYRLDIKRGKKVIFKILHQDKTYLDNFYADIIKTKQQFGYM